MHDPGCPPFLEVLSYLLSIILAFGMIGYLLLWLSVTKLQTVPPDALVFLLTFCVILVYAGFRLARGLFPAWWRRGRGPVLLREIVEIDGRM